MITERQKTLVKVSVEILDILREYDFNSLNISEKDKIEIFGHLGYDNVPQDMGCLVDDLKIEFDLD